LVVERSSCVVTGRVAMRPKTSSASSCVAKQRTGVLRATPRGSKPIRSNRCMTSGSKMFAPAFGIR
jgi:hypothetical protein